MVAIIFLSVVAMGIIYALAKGFSSELEAYLAFLSIGLVTSTPMILDHCYAL
jgi:hypothetical protein